MVLTWKLNPENFSRLWRSLSNVIICCLDTETLIVNDLCTKPYIFHILKVNWKVVLGVTGALLDLWKEVKTHKKGFNPFSSHKKLENRAHVKRIAARVMICYIFQLILYSETQSWTEHYLYYISRGDQGKAGHPGKASQSNELLAIL